MRPGGTSGAWRRLRREILERDGYRCRVRLHGVCTTVATHVHHTHGLAVTGDDPRYLVASCAACNLKIGKPKGDPPPRGRTAW